MSGIQTLATLVLGGAFDATELGENDIQPDSKLIEELQQRLVTGTDDVYIQLIDRAELDRVTAERDALQQRLNAADQRNDELVRGRGEPVMKLEAERLWGGAGEYAVSFVKAGWLDECRRTGGEFLLYTDPPAPAVVMLPETKAQGTHNSHDWDEGHADGWAAYDAELKRLNPAL